MHTDKLTKGHPSYGIIVTLLTPWQLQILKQLLSANEVKRILFTTSGQLLHGELKVQSFVPRQDF